MAATAAAVSSGAGIASRLQDWSAVDAVLTSAIADQVFPGCAAGVLSNDGSVLYAKAFGSYVFPGQTTPLGGNNPAVTTSGALFDMASCTKIIGATTASALLYQAGMLDLNMPISDPSLLGPSYAQNGKATIRIRDCLLHQAGYPPDPDPAYNDPTFGCPATDMEHPPLTFNCSERIFQSLLAQTLQYPPGTQWLYSDLSMITMQYVIGTVAYSRQLVDPSSLRSDCGGADPVTQPGLHKTCYFEAFIRTRVLGPAGMTSATFLPPQSLWASTLPTWNDTYYRNEVVQGVVSDENAYALGGVAGHAGVFAALTDILQFVGMWAGYAGQPPVAMPAAAAAAAIAAAADVEARALRSSKARSHKHKHAAASATSANWAAMINSTTRATFFAAPDAAFSPRALGWVTQAATDTYLGCGNFSSVTAYHTGYTGEWAPPLMCFLSPAARCAACRGPSSPMNHCCRRLSLLPSPFHAPSTLQAPSCASTPPAISPSCCSPTASTPTRRARPTPSTPRARPSPTPCWTSWGEPEAPASISEK